MFKLTVQLAVCLLFLPWVHCGDGRSVRREATCCPGDRGSAPDPYLQSDIEAYPGVPARFPTAGERGSLRPGPHHHNHRRRFSLGDQTDPPDQNSGLALPERFDPCQQTSLHYTISVHDPGPVDVYVNVWIDWDHGGSWGELVACEDGLVNEWAVRNQKHRLSGAGVFQLSTPNFLTLNGERDMWIRISVSERPFRSADGSGPVGGFSDGETEDYLWRHCHGFKRVYRAGVEDGFFSLDGEETANHSRGMLSTSKLPHAQFDEVTHDQQFMHSFENIREEGYVITAARLVMRMRVTGTLPENDAISLTFKDSTGQHLAPRWGGRLGPYEGVPGLLQRTWSLETFPEGHTFQLDLAHLPDRHGRMHNLIDSLNRLGILDFMVQDDTQVDFIDLEVEFSCPN